MIDKNSYQDIINSLKVGNSVAEHDFILKDARVDTPVLEAVFNDNYDIVTGRKGAGKTAIFKILGQEQADHLFLQKNLVVISGVNASSESIFAQFKEDFKKYTEQDFENFWKIYFVSLAYNLFLKSPKYQKSLKGLESEINDFKRATKSRYTRHTGTIGHQKNPGMGDPSSQQNKISARKDRHEPKYFALGAEVEIKLEESQSAKPKNKLYTSEITASLDKILEASNLKLWIVLDRLDEVFDRYSMIEFNGLRGLLKAYKSFDVIESSDRIRVKLFLRDDIKQFLTEDKSFKRYYPNKNIKPLVAATHIFAKESPVLNWTEDEIQQLILFRLLQSEKLRLFLDLNTHDTYDLRERLRDKNLRTEIWNKLFPEKITNSPSLKWIYRRLTDSNGVVTPRSVIDMLSDATEFQKKNIALNFEDKDYIFPLESLQEGLNSASKNKLDNDIFNEFPRDQENIKKLSRAGKHKLNARDLKKLTAKTGEEIAEGLRRIGILYFIKHSNEYRVVMLFRPALGISYKY